MSILRQTGLGLCLNKINCQACFNIHKTNVEFLKRYKYLMMDGDYIQGRPVMQLLHSWLSCLQ